MYGQVFRRRSAAWYNIDMCIYSNWEWNISQRQANQFFEISLQPTNRSIKVIYNKYKPIWYQVVGGSRPDMGFVPKTQRQSARSRYSVSAAIIKLLYTQIDSRSQMLRRKSQWRFDQKWPIWCLQRSKQHLCDFLFVKSISRFYASR